MYEPPEKEDDPFGFFKEAYDAGYNAALEGKKYKNPYKLSGHERDTTFDDELHQQFYNGYYHE